MSACPELPGVQHVYVDADGLRTHVALAGPEDAPAVLLVHGWPQNWWAWRTVMPELAGRFRVIAPDLRGHGWSAAPQDGYEKEALASDLLSLLDALAIERVTWVGHDWGGWTGLLAALRVPQRIERLLGLCIPHLWTAPHISLASLLLGYQGPISLPLWGPRLADPLARRILQVGRGTDPLPAADVALFADQIPAHVTVAMYRSFLTRELAPIVRGRYADAVLQVPTTLIAGARDLVTRSMPAGEVAGQPQIRVEILDGVAHWVPEQRAAAVVDWVAGRPRA
ncbi:MAG: alpha/beta hydrolase [Solirubrobacteraceae bacterium]